MQELFEFVRDNRVAINRYVCQQGKIAAIKIVRNMFDSNGNRIQILAPNLFTVFNPEKNPTILLDLWMAKMMVEAAIGYMVNFTGLDNSGYYEQQYYAEHWMNQDNEQGKD